MLPSNIAAGFVREKRIHLGLHSSHTCALRGHVVTISRVVIAVTDGHFNCVP